MNTGGRLRLLARYSVSTMPRLLHFLALAAALALAAPAPAPKFDTSQQIQVSPLRQQLILDYIHQHYDSAATSINITPKMIVIHWTAINSLKSTLAAFTPDVLAGRDDIQRGGRLNTGAHFLVDRDGTIYKLLDETVMARHTIGLNRIAIGIENVGSGSLTAAQLVSNQQLVRYLVNKFPIQYLIGHYEYGAFRNSPLWEEKDKTYFTVKLDPGKPFMVALRAGLAGEGIKLKAAP